MQFVRSLMGWVAVVSGVLVLAPTVGCKKKDDAKTEEAKADDNGDKKKGGDDYATGDVLKHVPSSCKAGRIYVNVSKLLKNEAIQDSASALQDKLVESMGKSDSKKASKALKSLKKSGIDVTKDVKEIALCMEESKGDPVVAIGGNFAGKDPIGAIVKASEDSGDDKELEKKESDGVEYAKDGKQYVAAVAPNVIVFTRDKDSFSDLKKEGDVSDDWNAGKGRILAFTVNEKKSGKFIGTITEAGDDLEVKFTGEFKGNTGEEIEDNPKGFKKQLEMMQDKIASKLKKGPFKKIADDIGNAKIKVDENTVTVTATIPADDIGDSIKKAVDASDEDLKAAIDL